MNKSIVVNIHKENMTKNLEDKRAKKKDFQRLEGANLVIVGIDLSHFVTQQIFAILMK